MKLKILNTYLGVALFLSLLVVTSAYADFTNGDFEAGSLTGWSVSTGSNPGVTLATPPENTTEAALNLTSGGTNITQVVTASTETGVDSNVGSGGSLRYPKYGTYASVVNFGGSSTNSNTLSQTMTVGVADIDPSDGKIHVRFAVAPVLNNPSHAANQQPYFFVKVTNITRSSILFSTFKYANQPGVPWQAGTGSYQYTNWQLIDIAPGNSALQSGDQVELKIIASRCSLGGHAGYVYVDGIGSFLPGLSVVATGPNAANDGQNITYTYTYQNGGVSGVTNAVVAAVLPANTTFVSLNAPGASCTSPSVGGTGTVSCNVGSVAANGSGSFSVTVQINPSTTGTISHGNYSIAADSVSELIGPLVNTTVTSGITYADLGIDITNGRAAVGWGQSIQYTITVTNNGPNDVTGATVTDTFPAQFENITWTCSASAGATCSASGTGNISDSVNIDNGHSVVYTVSGNVVAGTGSGTLSNTASVSAPGGITDNASSNNSDIDIDDIGDLRTLSLTKTTSLGGRVISSPAAIDCMSGCTSASGDFVDASSVSMTAIASTGYTFLGWGGSCSGTGSCVVTMSGNQTLSASFSMASCSSGFYGADCTQCPGAGNCSGHGTCDDGVSGSGVCTCNSGYSGASCNIASTPTPVPTSAPSATATPAVTPTPTATATPTVSTKEIRGSVTFNGQPMAGVVVEGGELGVAVTDENGDFVFRSVPSGKVFTLTPRKSGYDFDPVASAEAGSFHVISGASGSFNSGDCTTRDMSTTLMRIAEYGKRLRDYGVSITDRGQVKLRRISEEDIRFVSKEDLNHIYNAGRRFIKSQYLTLMTSIGNLPDANLTCPAQSSCSKVSNEPQKRRVLKSLQKIRARNLFLSRRTREALGLASYSVDIQPPKIQGLHKKSIRSVKNFPKFSARCE